MPADADLQDLAALARCMAVQLTRRSDQPAGRHGAVRLCSGKGGGRCVLLVCELLGADHKLVGKLVEKLGGLDEMGAASCRSCR